MSELRDMFMAGVAAANRQPSVKAKVFRTRTLVGHGWRWQHRCRLKGGVLITSYPLETWDDAYGGALAHLEACP